ncbi:MAG: hypothetical protein K2O59_15150 [Lachnospiraceae bacterium]|nr:hypothetical protein [Lachnospiraceae bacterium]
MLQQFLQDVIFAVRLMNLCHFRCLINGRRIIPTAASAFLPTKFPTMMESAML